MLTVAKEKLSALAQEHGKSVSVHLYGQEINLKTYAIATADLLIKGIVDEFNGEFSGPEWKEIRAHIRRLAEMISGDGRCQNAVIMSKRNERR